VNDAVNRVDDSPLKKVIASTILGSPDFVREKSQQHLRDKQSDRNMPAVRVLNRPGIDEIIKVVENEVKENALAKKVSLYFCHRYSGARLLEIGERFGMSDAAVAQASRRMRIVYEKDETLRKRLDVVKAKLKMSAVET
jgi:putative transposase